MSECVVHNCYRIAAPAMTSFEELCNSKLFNDPIHGSIRLDPLLMSIVDTLHFQRLRDLHQLGSCYYVFPGASHRRFEHCLGVAHLATVALQRLQRAQPELNITNREIQLVSVAGLTHDLGHGPFSHVFDGEFMKSMRPDLHWHHEQGSINMLEHMVSVYEGINLDSQELNFVKELIDPVHHRPTYPKQYLYDIVANKRNSIDVDKLDYISRDCYYLGTKRSYDGYRLLEMTRVVDDQVCFYAKSYWQVLELFQTRYALHKSVYTHPVTKAVEYMIVDALMEADSVLKIADSVLDPDRYLLMSDSILNHIAISNDPRLAKSQNIITRIRERNLYKLVAETVLESSMCNRMKSLQADDIIARQHGGHLQRGDLQVQLFGMDYAKKTKNPVDSVRFFDKMNLNQSYQLRADKISRMLPEQFSEHILRVFCRDPTPEKMRAAKEALDEILRERGCPSPTPALGALAKPSFSPRPSRTATPLPKPVGTVMHKRIRASSTPIALDLGPILTDAADEDRRMNLTADTDPLVVTYKRARSNDEVEI